MTWAFISMGLAGVAMGYVIAKVGLPERIAHERSVGFKMGIHTVQHAFGQCEEEWDLDCQMAHHNAHTLLATGRLLSEAEYPQGSK